MILAETNKVYLIWSTGHKEIEGNEVADQLVRRGSLCPFIGPDPSAVSLRR
jgi:ribonuclease HI